MVLTAYSWGRGAKGREKKKEIDSSCFLSMALVKTAYFETDRREAVRYFITTQSFTVEFFLSQPLHLVKSLQSACQM